MTLSSPPVLPQRASRGALLFALAALLSPSGLLALNIDLVTTTELGFGRIVATSSPGTVTIAPTGARNASGGVVLGSEFGASAGSFTVAGDANASYSITLPAFVQLLSGTHTMTVDGFTSSPSGSGNLGPGGSETIHLGATLHTGSSQTAGSYSGSFVVIVSYN